MAAAIATRERTKYKVTAGEDRDRDGDTEVVMGSPATSGGTPRPKKSNGNAITARRFVTKIIRRPLSQGWKSPERLPEAESPFIKVLKQARDVALARRQERREVAVSERSWGAEENLTVINDSNQNGRGRDDSSRDASTQAGSDGGGEEEEGGSQILVEVCKQAVHSGVAILTSFSDSRPHPRALGRSYLQLRPVRSIDES